MTTTNALDRMIEIIAATLQERGQADSADPADNPYVNHDAEQLSFGVRKFADNIPAVSKAAAGSAGFEMEHARIEGAKAGSQHRQAVNYQRKQRATQRQRTFDRLVDKKTTPKPERMTQAWTVMVGMVGIVHRIATEKQQWAARFLGTIDDDLPELVVEKMALVLARGRWDLDVMAEAATELGEQARTSKRIPGDQMSEADRRHRQDLRKAKKDLMSMVNTCTKHLLADLYRQPQNLRWENLDQIDTVIASIGGVGADPYVSRTKADRAPAMLGATFPRPGEIPPGAVALAINVAITDRGLDRLTELLLDEDSRRADGAVKWRELAEQVFNATPDGAELWVEVERRTANLEVPARARAAAALLFVRRTFDWLPGLVVNVVESFDHRAIGYNHGHVVLESDFDAYVEWVRGKQADPMGEKRYPLRPALTFATAEDAARALVQNLGQLFTGEDLVDSIIHS